MTPDTTRTEHPRVFHLRRTVDVSGTSGTGIVAQGVVFADGTCALRWLTDKSSTAVYASIEDLEAIHGHGGSTVIEFAEAQTAAAVEALRHHVRTCHQGSCPDCIAAAKVYDDLSTASARFIADVEKPWREALEQAADRMDAAFANLGPTMTADDREAVAQALWFGIDEARALLATTPSAEAGE